MAREHGPFLIPVTELLVARERARCGDRDEAIAKIRDAASHLHRAGQHGWSVFSAGVLVEALLDRGAEGDLAEAQDAIDQLANLRTDEVWAIRDIWLLRLRALMAGARGDDAVYRDDQGTLHSLSPICTHMHCDVSWNTAEATWDCPCHGSRFDATGNVVNGPANTNLSAESLPTSAQAAS